MHTLEMELESYKTHLDEESELRIDIERQLVKVNGECATYRTKYETECLAHADEVEELRYVDMIFFVYLCNILHRKHETDTILLIVSVSTN